MFQQTLVPRTTPVITPDQLAAFGRFDCPQSSPPDAAYQLCETFIDAATTEVETLAAVALSPEQILLTMDFFPGTVDPRVYYDYILYSWDWIPSWWNGWQVQESVIPIRTPILTLSSPPVGEVTSPVITYNDENGDSQTFASSNYTVFANKLTLNVGCWWPCTSRLADCVQLTYWAGYTTVPSRLQLAVMFLANHFYESRSIVSINPTSEVGMTLSKMLSSYRSYRIAT